MLVRVWGRVCTVPSYAILFSYLWITWPQTDSLDYGRHKKHSVPLRHQFRPRDVRLAVCFFQVFVFTGQTGRVHLRDNKFGVGFVTLTTLWHILLMVTLVMALSLWETQLYNINHSRYISFNERLGTEFKYLFKQGRPDPRTDRGRALW